MIRRTAIPVLVAALAALQPLAARAQRPSPAETAAQARRDSLSRALRSEVVATVVAAGVAEPHGLLMLEGLRAGPALQVRMPEGSLPDSTLARVHAAVLARAAAWPRDTLTMLVRLDAGPAIEDMKGREHQPELRNRTEIADAVTRFVGSHMTIGPVGATFTAMMRMAVSRSGQVVYAEIVEPSGNMDVDAFAVGLGRRMRFVPARVGSQAVDVWVVLPITVRLLPPGNL